MTIKELLEKVDRLKPSAFDSADKIAFLNEVEGVIYNNVIAISAGNTTIFTAYKFPEDEEKTLLVPAPYDGLYYYYLCAKIDAENQEIESYSNNMALYNSLYEDFAAYYIRSHIPASSGYWRCS